MTLFPRLETLYFFSILAIGCMNCLTQYLIAVFTVKFNKFPYIIVVVSKNSSFRNLFCALSLSIFNQPHDLIKNLHVYIAYLIYGLENNMLYYMYLYIIKNTETILRHIRNAPNNFFSPDNPKMAIG